MRTYHCAECDTEYDQSPSPDLDRRSLSNTLLEAHFNIPHPSRQQQANLAWTVVVKCSCGSKIRKPERLLCSFALLMLLHALSMLPHTLFQVQTECDGSHYTVAAEKEGLPLCVHGPPRGTGQPRG